MLEVLEVVLLVGYDHVDIVLALQAVVRDRQQRVHVGRQIDAGDGRALVHDHVEEARILVGEPVVVLPPDGAR